MIIKVKHTVQMGHRLWKPEGKCNNLHGHTWTVILSIEGVMDGDMLLDYHDVKKQWRGYLDEHFDHRFLIDLEDPLINVYPGVSDATKVYPGVAFFGGMPTVENIARSWWETAPYIFGHEYAYTVELWEGDNNAAIAT